MAGHLDVLMSIFPGKIFLDVDDIAKCLGQSKGHIYNLSSAKKLPFQLEWGLGDKVQVSIVEMAKYLDSKLQIQPVKEEKLKLVNPVIVAPKKVGRPRGITKTKIQLAFQTSLSMAIMKAEISQTFSIFREELEGLECPPNEEMPCVEKFDDLKYQALSMVHQARAYLNSSLLELELVRKPKFVRKKTF
jgi:hypothetical protein